MEQVYYGTHNTCKFAQEDVISIMPENVMTNIMDRLPIEDAVRTSILSSNWRHKWTLLTELEFDGKLFNRLAKKNDWKTLYRLFLHLKGPIRKFYLNIPPYSKMLDVEDVNHWIFLLSKKGIEELQLVKMSGGKLKLPTHLYSCINLKKLTLFDCCIPHSPRFHAFTSLLSLVLFFVSFENFNCEELIAQCPVLEMLEVTNCRPITGLILIQFAKHGSIKILQLSESNPDNVLITSSNIFQLASLPKLQHLTLNVRCFELLAEAGAKKVPATFLCLKTLNLSLPDFSKDIMLSFLIEMICASPNLQTLEITVSGIYMPQITRSKKYTDSCAFKYYTMGKLQLRSVVFNGLMNFEYEVCLIKELLMCSPLLKKMVIRPDTSWVVTHGDTGRFEFAQKLLKLHRASPTAEIIFY